MTSDLTDYLRLALNAKYRHSRLRLKSFFIKKGQKMKNMLLLLGLFLPVADAWADSQKDFKLCQKKLKAAQKLDLLYDLKMDPPEAVVVVGPTFATLPFEAKEGFAETINCFFTVGKKDKYFNFSLLDYLTHKQVARYSFGHLSVD